jgi:hypothetical protein
VGPLLAAGLRNDDLQPVCVKETGTWFAHVWRQPQPKFTG